MKKVISIILSVAMLLTMVTGLSFTAQAKDYQGVRTSASNLKTGDTFQMGNYPQSEVTDSSLISTLNGLSCKMHNYGYMQNADAENHTYDSVDMTWGDVKYNGTLYRKVTINEYRPAWPDSYSSSESSYQYDNDYTIGNTYYFKWEPIVWQVLDKEDDGVYVMSKMLLDSQAYNNYCEDITWENCSLRSWLNNDFYSSAFSANEKKKINTITNNNEDNPSYGTYGGNDTRDNLWILSFSDAINSRYGFFSYSDGDVYDMAKMAQGSDYAKSQGLWVSSSGSYAGISLWWLRTPGYDSKKSTEVGPPRYAYYGLDVNYTSEGVRPAFKLNLNAEVNSLDEKCDDYTSGSFRYSILQDGSAEIIRYLGDETVLSIPSTIDGYIVRSIGYLAFSESNITNATIPESVTSIDKEAFYKCANLTSINIPKNVTYVGKGAFSYCTSLKSVSLPLGVEYIIEGAFYECVNLTDVYYAGSKDQWNNIFIDSANECLTNATIHYNSTSGHDEPEPDDPKTETTKTIALFTSNKSMSVEEGNNLSLGFGLAENGQVDNKKPFKKMALVVSDSSVISLSDYKANEYGYYVDVKGLKQGSSNLTITDSETGANLTVTIRVVDTVLEACSYRADRVDTFYPNVKFDDKVPTNLYDLNGIYVNNYQYTKNNGSYEIEFDAYNSKSYNGAVDIFDADGKWIGYEEITKYSDITSLWDTGEQAFYLIVNTARLVPGGKDSNFLTYEQESFSKKTHISFSVPDGGYFTISNNVMNSWGTYFSNAFDILFEGGSAVLGIVASDSTKLSALSEFKESLTKELTKSELSEKVDKAMIGSVRSQLVKETKKFSKAEFKDQIGSAKSLYLNLAEITQNFLECFGIKWEDKLEICWKDVIKTGVGIGESAFEALAGPAGAALKAGFSITKGSNLLLCAIQMCKSGTKPNATFYTRLGDGEDIAANGVVINTKGNVDSEAVLQTFKISNDDVVKAVLNSSNPLEDYELYNICFVKNEKLVQPSGKVKVQIPIPQGMKKNTAKIYRQEKDGSWTILDAHVEGKYLVFETEHFSLYAIVGDMAELKIKTLPVKTEYTYGEHLDTSGLVLEQNGESITDGYLCDPSVLLANTGKQKITVNYGGSTVDFYVNVMHKHSYTSKVTKAATCTDKGIVTYTCTVCGDSYKEVIPALGHNYVNGVCTRCRAKDPNYIAPKPKADKTKAQITAFKKKTVKLKSVKKGKKSFTATWKKVSGANGYQVQYSLKKNMKSSKTKNVKGAKKTKLTVKKLKKGKKYYVRIRAYKTINGKKVYSKWSAKKTVKVK